MPAAETPRVNNGDVIEITINQRMDNQSVLNVLHYVVTGTEGEVGIDDLMRDIKALWITANKLIDRLWVIQTTDVKYLSLRGQVIAPTRTAYWNIPFTDTEGPIVAPPALPVNSTAVITKRTARSGRSQHGDFFVAGLAANSHTDSVFKDATLVELNNLGKELVDDITLPGMTLKPFIYHGVEAVTTDYLMQAITQPEVRTMRRRTVGRGE